MASSSSSHQHNVEHLAFSGIEPDTKRRKISESSRLFDVFINHRGPDAKETLAIPLYNSLQELGVGAFLDKEEMEVGEYFPSTIETAIRSASAHLAIFSERYAGSAWCLAELDLMLQSGAKIFPIFYGVKPSELRYIQSGAYADAFKSYKEKDRYLSKLETWEKALQSASLITGLEINSADSFRHSETFKNLVLDVKNEVERTKPLFVAQHPVALHKLVKEFEIQCLDKLVHDFEKQCGLNGQGNDHTKIVGIFGMGGAGKTTLAKELFNRKRSNYTATCFLFDVREKSSRYGLPSLQAEFIRELLPGSPSEFRSMEDGINYVRDRLGRSGFLSFLVVVDDIDHVKQLDALCLMDMANNSHNSLVIVTTRDVGVLTSAGVTNRYNLKGLNRDDGRELFCWHSFGRPNAASGYENLVDAFVGVCGGLPLSLQVLGRHVHGRPLYYWELQLCKVRESLHPDIKDILRISFDALNRVEKQIFMDIACFFVEKSMNTAIRVWEGSGWGALYALETLKDRCLIEEGEGLDGLMWEDKPVVFKMHDHLRDLGREMSDDLCFPPRHWSPKHHKSLEKSGFQNIITQTKGRCFHSIYDRSMGSQITFFMGEPDEVETSSSLLWLQLDLHCGYLASIPPWIPLQNLQCLRVSHGYLKTLWQGNIQAPSQLKELQMYLADLEEFPDFSGISINLERVVLDAKDLPIEGWSLLASLRVYPRSLVLACSTIHGELTCNNRGDKTTFKSSRFTSLVIRNFLKQCSELSLYNIGESTALKCVLSNLESLEINNQISTTKVSICGSYCPSLLSLKIHDMDSLIEMNLLAVKSLNYLEIKRCRSLKRLSEMSNFRNLLSFKISECPKIEELSVAHLTCLEKTTIKNCEQLQIVSGLSNLRKLVEVDITHCPAVELCFVDASSLKEIRVGGCGKLKCLELDSCKKLEMVEMFNLEKLVTLKIRDCPELQELMVPNCLTRLIIESCQILKKVSGDINPAKLSISDCPELQELPTTLNHLHLSACIMLKSISEISHLRNLVELNISQCWELELELRLEDMYFLKRFTIDECPKLKSLRLYRCQLIKVVSGNCDPVVLDIKECPELEQLPCFTRLTCLEYICILSCGKLQNIYLEGCEKLKEIDIRCCWKLQNITLSTTLISLSLEGCKELQRVAGSGYLTELRGITISRLPSLPRMRCLEIDFRLEVIEINELRIRGMQFLERITFDRNVKVKYLELNSCKNLETIMFGCKELTELRIQGCPKLEELPVFKDADCLESVIIDGCGKFKRLILIECQNLRSVSGNFELKNLYINQCPELEELECLSSMSFLKVIDISYCTKVKSITLPTTLTSLSICNCEDLQRISATGDFMEISGGLTIRNCPMLEGLPMLTTQSCTEDIKIYECEKLQNITMPTKVSNLYICNCRDLQRISATGDFMEISKKLTISECPVLEELPMFPMQSCIEDIEIEECEKLQNITLPTKVSYLYICNCGYLQRIAATGDFMEISGLTIINCPMLEELPMFPMQSFTEDIEIKECEKLQNISMPTEVSNLYICNCGYLQRISVTGDFMEISGGLTIRNCPVLQGLPMLTTQSCTEDIKIYECEKLQNITMPTKVSNLYICNCGDLQGISATGDFMEISKKLTISGCPVLEGLPMFPMQSCTEDIEIEECEKLQNITMPTKVSNLYICNCGDLQRILPTGDFMEISKKLTISGCPVLEELPMFPMQSCTEEIEIEDCEKLQNITMPIKVSNLSISNCRDLQRVSTTGDFMEILELVISDCPLLEELPMFPRQSCIEEIEIYKSEKVENVTRVEELHVLRWMYLSYCSKALIQDCIHKLKTLPMDGMYMSGRVVDGAESNLKESLFSENNISVETVMEIGSHELSELSVAAIVVCFVVVVESFIDVEGINSSLLYRWKHFEVREGEWIITCVACCDWACDEIVQLEDILRKNGILKKTYRIKLKKDEESQSIRVIRIIADKLYHL